MSGQADMFQSKSAIFSNDRQYRFVLFRSWMAAPRLCFLMLNPSTADESQDDPTVRRCLDFAKRLDFGQLYVVNLFALRATNPAQIALHPEPIGEPDNKHWIAVAMDLCSMTICAWGAHPAAMKRMDFVRELVAKGRKLHCLGLTKNGQPKHPLYLRSDCKPQPFIIRDGNTING